MENTMTRLWELIQFYFILFLTPFIFGFQMLVLFPKLVKIIEAGPIQQYVHIFFATFFLVNIIGNMILSSAKEFNALREVLYGDRVYCEICKKWRPRDCLHCRICNTCILKRDHHCGFLSNCIGHGNKRYYVLFLGHVAIAMLYATLYNFCLIIARGPDDLGAMIYIARILNPSVWYIIPEPMGKKDVYTLYMFLNAAIGLWSGYLFYCHLRNSATGVTFYEDKYKPELRHPERWQQNLLDVFGEKWYLAMIWPFCTSPIPRRVKIE